MFRAGIIWKLEAIDCFEKSFKKQVKTVHEKKKEQFFVVLDQNCVNSNPKCLSFKKP
jgi:hypothetical protein